MLRGRRGIRPLLLRRPRDGRSVFDVMASFFVLREWEKTPCCHARDKGTRREEGWNPHHRHYGHPPLIPSASVGPSNYSLAGRGEGSPCLEKGSLPPSGPSADGHSDDGIHGLVSKGTHTCTVLRTVVHTYIKLAAGAFYFWTRLSTCTVPTLFRDTTHI